MDEKKINLIAANLIEVILEHMNENKNNDKEEWLNSFAAVHAMKVIIQRSPTVFDELITPEEAEEAEKLGLDIGNIISDMADEQMNRFKYRN